MHGLKLLFSLHSLNNINITNYFYDKPRFNVVFSRNNLPRIKDWAYVINLDGRNGKGTHWISLIIHNDVAISFNYFGIEYIPQEVIQKIRDKPSTRNIFRMSCCHRIYAGKKNIAILYLLVFSKWP